MAEVLIERTQPVRPFVLLRGVVLTVVVLEGLLFVSGGLEGVPIAVQHGLIALYAIGGFVFLRFGTRATYRLDDRTLVISFPLIGRLRSLKGETISLQDVYEVGGGPGRYGLRLEDATGTRIVPIAVSARFGRALAERVEKVKRR